MKRILCRFIKILKGGRIMKVIDLMQRNKTNKSMPEKIIIYGTELKYDKDLLTYVTEGTPIDRFFNLWVMYDEEVEIIEDTPKEDKKIEKLYEITNDGDYMIHYPDNKQLMNKINEIIDKINGE